MNLHSCDLCSNPAVIHDTVTHGGVVKVRHLCRAHGLKVWRAALPGPRMTPEEAAQDPVVQSLVTKTGQQLQRRGRKSL